MSTEREAAVIKTAVAYTQAVHSLSEAGNEALLRRYRITDAYDALECAVAALSASSPAEVVKSSERLILKHDGTPLAAGDIPAGRPVTLIYKAAEEALLRDAAVVHALEQPDLEVIRDLVDACRFVKEFLDKLEDGTVPDDPLSDIRRRIHKPLRDKLEPAIAKGEEALLTR